MATKPSYQYQARPLLLPATLLVILAAAAEGGCRHKCGHIDIPFPFGIGVSPGCFRDGFEVLCDGAYNPPRAFLPGERIKRVANYSTVLDMYQNSWSLVELKSISVATGEVQAYVPVSFSCSTDSNGSYFSEQQAMDFSYSVFAVSATRNILIDVGVNVETVLLHEPRGGSTFTRLSCSARVLLQSPTARNGSCRGRGCCEEPLPPDDFLGRQYSLDVGGKRYKTELENYPCSYGMLVEKSWYNFSTLDMCGDRELLKLNPRGVPLVLDFTAGNTLCSAEGHVLQPTRDYACVSYNSSCANTSFSGTNYICKCSEHYTGNPYIPDGCQDIDECKLPELYNCTSGGVCKNRLGGYDCPCAFGMKGDGKLGTCADIFPLPAKAAVGKCYA